MKDKAEVLVEVERLRGVQAELNAELAQLHTALQRERSRNTDPRAKDKVCADPVPYIFWGHFAALHINKNHHHQPKDDHCGT